MFIYLFATHITPLTGLKMPLLPDNIRLNNYLVSYLLLYYFLQICLSVNICLQKVNACW